MTCSRISLDPLYLRELCWNIKHYTRIGLFYLLVTDCFMCHIVIVDRYKYKWLRRDLLHVCNEFLLLSYILWTQQVGSLTRHSKLVTHQSPNAELLPIPLKRLQFLVRLAFVMTINKSQKQSVEHVGINLQTSVFSHGQLYVAFSRCASPLNISVLLPEKN